MHKVAREGERYLLETSKQHKQIRFHIDEHSYTQQKYIHKPSGNSTFLTVFWNVHFFSFQGKLNRLHSKYGLYVDKLSKNSARCPCPYPSKLKPFFLLKYKVAG